MLQQSCTSTSYNVKTQTSQKFHPNHKSQTPQTSISVSHSNAQNRTSSYIKNPTSFVQSSMSLGKKLMES